MWKLFMHFNNAAISYDKTHHSNMDVDSAGHHTDLAGLFFMDINFHARNTFEWGLFEKQIHAKLFYDDAALDLMLLICFGDKRSGMYCVGQHINMPKIKGRYHQPSHNQAQYKFIININDAKTHEKRKTRHIFLPECTTECLYTASLKQLIAASKGRAVTRVFDKYDFSILESVGNWYPCEEAFYDESR